MFLVLEKRYTPTRSTNFNLVIILPSVVKPIHVYAFHRIMSTFHLMCILVTYYVHMHVIGSPEGVTLLEFETEQPEDQLEVQQ
jgi:predicted RNA-binding protein